MNFKLQIDTVPRHNGLAPPVGDIPHRNKEEFFECVLGGESPFCFGDFPQLSVEAFNGVCGVDEPSYIRPFRVIRPLCVIRANPLFPRTSALSV